MTDRFVLVNPEGLHPTAGYAHLTIAEAGRTAHLAGLCPLDADEQIVGLGDLGAQIDQVVANALAILSAADATPHDVVRSVIYVVSADSTVLASAWNRLNASQLAPAFATRQHPARSRGVGLHRAAHRDRPHRLTALRSPNKVRGSAVGASR